MIVYSSRGEKITLADKPFSSGGEGEVRNIVSPSHLTGNCVKIYYVQKRSRQQADKIKFMVDHPPQQIEHEGFKIGWPLDVVLQKKHFIGFMMPLAFHDSEQLVILTTPTISKKYNDVWQKFDRKNGKEALLNRLKLMNNIAIPVYLLHQTGRYVLQDFKPQNILVTPSGQVTICDMDSIQITDGRKMLFRGTAATVGYAPPEFENAGAGKSGTVPLEKSWDNFALSVVFYQLLLGLHPYAVTPKIQKDANSSDISTNISDDLFPFGKKADRIQIVPTLHNKFSILPMPIQDLFCRSFTLNVINRPNAEEWGKQLREIIIADSRSNPQKESITRQSDNTDAEIQTLKKQLASERQKCQRMQQEIDNLKVQLKTEKSKKKKGKWGWLFVLLFVIAAASGIYLTNENYYLNISVSDLNSQISKLKHENDNLNVSMSSLNSQIRELKQKNSEYEASLNLIGDIPLIIKTLKIGNVYYDGTIETDYGNALYHNNTMYLQPEIEYVGLKQNRTITLYQKLFYPSGELSTGTSSPAGYSTSTDIYLSREGKQSLTGWGGKKKGNWSAGNYRYEIWYKDVLLKTLDFKIY